MTRNEINRKLAAILTTLDEVDYAPESSIYMALGCNLDDFYTLKTLLVQSGLTKDNGDYSLSITPAGHQMAVKIMEFANTNR